MFNNNKYTKSDYIPILIIVLSTADWWTNINNYSVQHTVNSNVYNTRMWQAQKWYPQLIKYKNWSITLLENKGWFVSYHSPLQYMA